MIQWKLKSKNISDLKKYEKNPRSLSEVEYLQLSESVDKFGLIDRPIINKDNTIIGGHQRLAVLIGKGVKEAECWVPDRMLDEKEVEELNVRLNLNTGSWDFDILANAYEIGDLLNWGFDERDLGLGDKSEKIKKEKYIISLEFDNKDTMIEYMQKCEDLAHESSAKMKIKG